MKQTQAERRATLGSSDSAAAIGLSPYRTPTDVWLEKTGQAPPVVETERMHFGKVLEQVIADEYTRVTGKKVRKRNKTFNHPKHPWMTCHPDRTIDGEQCILECKSSDRFMAGDWGETGSDEVPESYLVQVYHQMEVMGYNRCVIAVLIGGNEFRHYDIEMDKPLNAQIVDREVEFWRLVESNEAPPPLSERDVNSIWRYSTEESISADPESMRALLMLKSLKAQKDELEEEEEGLRMVLKDLLRDKNAIVSADGTPLVTWKTHMQNYTDKGALAVKHPDLVASFTEERAVRKFLPKWKAIS